MPSIQHPAFQEFSKRQGCRWLHVSDRSQRLFRFENGALVRYDEDHFYDWSEAPESEFERLTAKRTFWNIKLERCRKEFIGLRDHINQQSDWHGRGFGPPPDDEAYTDLKKLKTRLAALTIRVESLDQEIGTIKAGQPNWRQDQSASRLKSAAEAKARLKEILNPNSKETEHVS